MQPLSPSLVSAPPPQPPAGRLLRRDDICRTVDLVGAGYEFCGKDVSERTPLLDGVIIL